jgi:hypothetical protein
MSRHPSQDYWDHLNRVPWPPGRTDWIFILWTTIAVVSGLILQLGPWIFIPAGAYAIFAGVLPVVDALRLKVPLPTGESAEAEAERAKLPDDESPDAETSVPEASPEGQLPRGRRGA